MRTVAAIEANSTAEATMSSAPRRRSKGACSGGFVTAGNHKARAGRPLTDAARAQAARLRELTARRGRGP